MTTNNTMSGRRRLLKDFYRSVILSEKCAVTFLREHGLLDEADDNQPCHRCGSVMQQKTRSDRGKEARLVLRCPRKGCQVTRSVRTGNEYFHNFYTDLNDRVSSKLSLCGMLEIMFFFVEDIPLTTTVQLTGKATDTVTEWYNMFREVCAAIVSSRDLMVGTIESPIQIDETRFDGYRKYKRKRKSEDGTGESEDSDDKEENHRNHGERIDGPWLFGLKNRTDCRYFFVERRDEETLVPIIQREVASGSVINSDESPAYANLNELGFEHWTTTTVNHQRHFMDPVSETHTQKNERPALDAKIIMKKMRGVPRPDLQSHLNEYCWRILRKDEEDLFLTFLSDVKQQSEAHNRQDEQNRQHQDAVQRHQEAQRQQEVQRQHQEAQRQQQESFHHALSEAHARLQLNLQNNQLHNNHYQQGLVQALQQHQQILSQAPIPHKGRMPRAKADARPRGRMTAYAFFVQTCREEHKKKHPEENVVFAEFSKKCAERWKTMLDKEKKRFHEMAENDKKRYDTEMQSYTPPKGEKQRGKKRKQIKDPNAPKRSLSAFFWFSNDERGKVKAQNPEYGVGDIAKELGRRWAEADQEAKGKYEALADKDKARYEKEMTAYKKKNNPALQQVGHPVPEEDVDEEDEEVDEDEDE